MNADRRTDRLAAPVDDAGGELMDVAARASRTLRPAPLASAFRARLRDGLMMAAHHQQAHRLLSGVRNEPPWGWLIGAAALGSAAGLIAVVLRSRAQTHRTAASAQIQN
ncbi:MAG TPA: hypothetical protein VF429_09285 [Anaerolineae bacterium]